MINGNRHSLLQNSGSYEGCSKSLWPEHEGEEIQVHSMHENTTSQQMNIYQEKK